MDRRVGDKLLQHVSELRARYPRVTADEKAAIETLHSILASIDRERLTYIAAHTIKWFWDLADVADAYVGVSREKDEAQRERLEAAEEMIRLQPKVMRVKQARRGAAAKLARDPKQVAKAEAFKLWKERHAGKHPKLRANEQFAAECMRRWPVLTSSKVILGWCTEWNKQAKRESQPAS